MTFVTSEQMRALDKQTIDAGTPGAELMDRAGRGIAQHLNDWANMHPAKQPVFLFLAGKGNNGGDAFVAARYLKQVGYTCFVWVYADRSEIKGDALDALDKLEQTDFNPSFQPEGEPVPLADFVIDALLGTGASGEPRGAVKDAISLANKLDGIKIALDVPSGLGSSAPFIADFTISLGFAKDDFLNPELKGVIGSVRVVDIGIEDPDSAIQCITKRVSARRKAQSHKGDYGKICCVGGSPGLTGAIALSAKAAVKSGAGLVSVITHQDLIPIVAPQVPEAMVKGDWTTINGYDALLIGPGLGLVEASVINELISKATAPVVLDADALNAFAGRIDEIKEFSSPLILTPHPAELGRLLGISSAEVESNRQAAVKEAAERSGAVVILKGAQTLVASPCGKLAMNLTGNPGMASGGTGDALAGIVVSLLGQGLEPYEAACIAVYEHGCGGDCVKIKYGEPAVCAGSLIEFIRC